MVDIHFVKASDYCESVVDGTHDSPKPCDEGFYLITSKHLLDYEINFASAYKISEADYNLITKRSNVKQWDILFSMIGTVGRVYIERNSNSEYACKNVGIFKCGGDKHKALWLYYVLKSPYCKQYISKVLAGSTQSYISLGNLRAFPVPVIADEKRNRIIEALSTFDKKIELNNKINDNLQKQARSLFNEFFIHSPEGEATLKTELGLFPSNFSVIKTGDLPILITDYVANGSFASLKENVQLYQERNYAYFIRNTDLKSGTFNVFVDEHSYHFLAKSKLFGGEIIVSNVGDVGGVFLCPKLDAPMTLGNNIIMIKPLQEELRYYLYIWFKWSLGQNLIQSIKGGSAQPKFNKTDFKSLPIVLPSKDILEKFHTLVRPIFEAIEQNQAESRTLTRLRDALLQNMPSFGTNA